VVVSTLPVTLPVLVTALDVMLTDELTAVFVMLIDPLTTPVAKEDADSMVPRVSPPYPPSPLRSNPRRARAPLVRALVPDVGPSTLDRVPVLEHEPADGHHDA